MPSSPLAFVLDIIGEFKDFLKETQNIKESTIKLIENNRELIEDDDEGALFWIALAKCQWDYGALDKEVLHRVKEDFREEKGLDLWKDDEKQFQKRKRAISDFINKLEEPNSKIKKLPKLTIRKPLFETGDCLSLKINDEYYGTALVISSDHSHIEYGSNLVVALKYWSKKSPTLDDFTNIEFLNLTFGNNKDRIHKAWYSTFRFREYKSRIVKIGNIDVSKMKEMNSNSYSNWSTLLHLIELQHMSTK